MKVYRGPCGYVGTDMKILGKPK